MTTEKLLDLIDRKKLFNDLADYWGIPKDWDGQINKLCEDALASIENAPTVDAYTREQLGHILDSLDRLEAENKELRTENGWLKSCVNCKIRKECSRHCGKVVHNCDHLEYGGSTVDAVEVVHGWTEVIEPFKVTLTTRCGLCGVAMGNLDNYCPNCGAKMDGDGNE